MPSFLRRWRAHWHSIRHSEKRDEKLLQELIRNGTLLHELRQMLVDFRKVGTEDIVWTWFSFLADSDLAKRRIISLTELMVPCKANGFGKVRLGNKHDGGYVCLDDFDGIEAALSLGISDDVSWDIEVADKSIPIYQYDHSVEGPPLSHPGFRFHKNKIGASKEDGETIVAIAEEKRLVKPASVILKIDIEHAEWDVLDSTTDETLSLFSQITGEFHGFDEVLDDKWFACAMRIFTKLNKQFRLVHVHGNNCATQIVLGNMLFPRSLELTFANRSRYDLTPSNEAFPGILDNPNNPARPDCGLGRFIYHE